MENISPYQGKFPTSRQLVNRKRFSDEISVTRNRVFRLTVLCCPRSDSLTRLNVSISTGVCNNAWLALASGKPLTPPNCRQIVEY
ncbi:hypothetical protein J6590_059972 [Homalodisca vitripennis]|nr:hypothetical protein J6590_059972 [Homalodisca vitripennis]